MYEVKIMKKMVSLLIILLFLLSSTGVASASTKKSYNWSYWDDNENPFVGKVVLKIDSTLTYNTGSFYSTTIKSTIGKVENFNDTQIIVNCFETTVITSWSGNNDKKVLKSNRTYYESLFR
jgi:hypothetical protein